MERRAFGIVMSYVNVNCNDNITVPQFGIVFHWVGFISSSDASHFFNVICLLIRLYCSFYVAAFCAIVLKCCTNICLITKHHFTLYYQLSSFRLPAARPRSLSPLLLSNSFLHFIFSCSSRPPWSQVPLPPNIHLFFLLPSTPCFLPAFRFCNPLSPTLLSLLLSLPW